MNVSGSLHTIPMSMQQHAFTACFQGYLNYMCASYTIYIYVLCCKVCLVLILTYFTAYNFVTLLKRTSVGEDTVVDRLVGVDAVQFNNQNASSNLTFLTTDGLWHTTPYLPASKTIMFKLHKLYKLSSKYSY